MICGPRSAAALGRYATVGGGQWNSAPGSYSTVPGGSLNYAGGYGASVGGGVRPSNWSLLCFAW